MERMSAEGVFFHRGCLKCDFCECGLRVNNYACDRLLEGEGKMLGGRGGVKTMVGRGQLLLKAMKDQYKNHSINRVLWEGDLGVVNRSNLETVNYRS